MASVVHDYQYSVQVKSRFDLLLSDDLNSEDPDLLIQKIQSRQKRESKSSKTKSKTNVEEDSRSKKTADSTEKNNIVKHVESTQKEEHNSQSYADSGKDEPSFNTTTEDYRENEIPSQLNQRNESWEPRGRGGRGRSSFTRSRIARNQGQREFDRHSGSEKSGVKPSIKKDGYGTGNWGTIEDELDVTMPAEGELLEQPFEDNEEEMPESKPAATVTEIPVEEQKTLTLNEYKELKKASKPTVQLTSKSSREANDGKDVFSNMVAHNKPKLVKPSVEVVVDQHIVEESKPTFFENSRTKTPGSRGRFVGNLDRDTSQKKHTTTEKIEHTPSLKESEQNDESNKETDAVKTTERVYARNFSRGGSRNFDRGNARNFERGNTRQFERGSSRRFERSGPAETDGISRNLERDGIRNFDHGVSRNFESGAQGNFGRGTSRHFERGAPRNFERGSSRNFERGGQRSFDRGAPRYFARGGPRGAPHNVNRNDAQDPTSSIETKNDEQGTKVADALTKDHAAGAAHQTDLPDRTGYRGRGSFARGRGYPGSAPFRPRGRFRGSFEQPAEGTSRRTIQPPSMDSDFDFPSLN